ncbi:MAG: SMC-Scp complex subunit ScpB [Anaerolineales bacterium]
MPDDYSTPTSPEPATETGWVRGDLPHEAETEKVKEKGPKKDRQPDRSAPAPNGALSLEALVESLLFVAEGPVTVARLAEALDVNAREVEAALAALSESYAQAGRGLSVQRFRDRAQLTTAPTAAAQIERFLGLAAATSLSRAALETLAIIAYQQPVTRPKIEAVRGVNSDSVIKNLLSKGLIEEVGRTEGPGRPVLYATTTEFLQHFGLTSLNDLPPLGPLGGDGKPALLSEASDVSEASESNAEPSPDAPILKG